MPVISETATPAEIQKALIEAIAKLEEYAQRLKILLDAYRQTSAPPVPE